MESIKVTFRHPTDKSKKEVSLDPTYEAQAIIGLLITNDFMPETPEDKAYILRHEESDTKLNENDTLADVGTKDGDAFSIGTTATAGS